MARKPPAKKAPTRKKPAARTAASAAPEKFTIKELVDGITATLPLVSRATVNRVVMAVFEEMTDAFVAGKIVNIRDFGKLQIQDRPERQGRNPATGESITIAAKTVPKFTFAKTLKDAAAR